MPQVVAHIVGPKHVLDYEREVVTHIGLVCSVCACATKEGSGVWFRPGPELRSPMRFCG